MPARSIGSATISFGLVSVPVNLFSSSESSASVSFNMLHTKCGSRLKQQYICAKEGTVVEKDEIDKGYEFAKGQYVRFTPEEIKALDEKATNTIDIAEFVPLAAVDRIYLEKVYYLGAGKGGERAYRLLVAALAGHRPRGAGPVLGAGQAVPRAGPPDGRHPRHGAAPLPRRAPERGRGAPPRRAVKDAELALARQLIEQGVGGRVPARELPRHRPRARARGDPAEGGRPGDHRRAGRGAADQDHRPDGRAEGEPGQARRQHDREEAEPVAAAKTAEQEPKPSRRKKAGRGISPAVVARLRSCNIHVGTSGWSYKEWKGTFYPADLPADDMLRYYASRLPDGRDQQLLLSHPQGEGAAGVGRAGAGDFRFVLKASRRITHINRLADEDDSLGYFLRTVNVLGRATGPHAVSVPTHPAEDLARLQRLPRPGAAAPGARRSSSGTNRGSTTRSTTRSGPRHRAGRGRGRRRTATPLVPTASWGYLRLRRTDYAEDELRPGPTGSRASRGGRRTSSSSTTRKARGPGRGGTLGTHRYGVRDVTLSAAKGAMPGMAPFPLTALGVRVTDAPVYRGLHPGLSAVETPP